MNPAPCSANKSAGRSEYMSPALEGKLPIPYWVITEFPES